MQAIILNFVCVIICLQFLSIKCTDPCDSYNLLNEAYGAERRSTSNVYNYTWQLAIGDDRLQPEGWYRVESSAGEEMPTSSPGSFRCGTWHPIWLNGNLPTIAEGVVTRAVCAQTIGKNCGDTWNIGIKRCSGGYLVYDLVKSPITDAAYCFGERCVAAYLSVYLDALGNSGKFYRRPLPGNPPRFGNQPVGVNKLKNMMTVICTRAGMEGNYTNHFGKRTCATQLYLAGVDEQDIMSRTGHRSEKVVMFIGYYESIESLGSSSSKRK